MPYSGDNSGGADGSVDSMGKPLRPNIFRNI